MGVAGIVLSLPVSYWFTGEPMVVWEAGVSGWRGERPHFPEGLSLCVFENMLTSAQFYADKSTKSLEEGLSQV